MISKGFFWDRVFLPPSKTSISCPSTSIFIKLGILDLKIIDISDAPESEFIVHIRKEKLHDREKELLLKQRIDLFRKIAAFYSDQIKF